MKKQEMRFSCHACGKVVECPSGEPPCGVLSGWLMISHWKGLGSVDHYYFCSFTCLKKWVDTQAPEIPKAFSKAFSEEREGEDTIK